MGRHGPTLRHQSRRNPRHPSAALRRRAFQDALFLPHFDDLTPISLAFPMHSPLINKKDCPNRDTAFHTLTKEEVVNLIAETLIISGTMFFLCLVPLVSTTAQKYSRYFFLIGTGALSGLLIFDLFPDVISMGGKS